MIARPALGSAARMLAAAAAIIVLAACGGGGRAALPIPSAPLANGSAPLAPASAVTATFSLSVPAVTAARAVAITVDAGTAQQQTASQSITPGSPRCTSASTTASLTCALGFAPAPGSHTFDLTVYDGAPNGANAQGNVLAQYRGVPFDVRTAVTSTIALTLQGAPASVAVIPAADQDLRGTAAAGFDVYGVYKADGVTPFDRTFTALAVDAKGAYIVGPGAPAMSFASSDPAVLSHGAASASNPNLFTVSALAYVPGAAVRFTVTATPRAAVPVSVTVPMRLAARNAPRIYVTNHLGGATCAGSSAAGSISVYDEQGDPVAVAGSFPGLCGAAGIAYVPRLNRLYSVQEHGNAIAAYDLEGNRVATDGAFPSLSFPFGIAYDAAHDRLIAGNFNAPLTVYDLEGNQLSVAGNWNEREGVAPYLPYGIVADQRNGRLYVADAGYNRAVAYDANGNALFSWAARNGATGIAQEAASGDLYVTGDAQAVLIYDRQGKPSTPPCARASVCTSAASWANAAAAIGIAQSPGNGDFYVTNYANDTITVYDPSGAQIPTRGTGFRAPPLGNTNGPIGIAIVP